MLINLSHLTTKFLDIFLTRSQRALVLRNIPRDVTYSTLTFPVILQFKFKMEGEVLYLSSYLARLILQECVNTSPHPVLDPPHCPPPAQDGLIILTSQDVSVTTPHYIMNVFVFNILMFLIITLS